MACAAAVPKTHHEETAMAANGGTVKGHAYTTIDYTIRDGILTITLNRPGQLNAFTVTMADELEDVFTRGERRR
jgi:1,4-dihydroxy-2-naphthoyl-CoA synthase